MNGTLRCIAAAVLALAASAGLALSAPVIFRTEQVIVVGQSDPNLPVPFGVETGDKLVIEVLADNGNASPLVVPGLSYWLPGHVISATARVRGYAAEFVPPFSGTSGVVFSTVYDASDGDFFILSASVAAIGLNNSDNAGPGSPWLFLNGLLLGDGNTSFGSTLLTDPDTWTVTAVPLPATLPLMALALGLVGLLSRRRAA